MKIKEMMQGNAGGTYSTTSQYDVESVRSGGKPAFSGNGPKYAKSELGGAKVRLQQLSIDVSNP